MGCMGAQRRRVCRRWRLACRVGYCRLVAGTTAPPAQDASSSHTRAAAATTTTSSPTTSALISAMSSQSVLPHIPFESSTIMYLFLTLLWLKRTWPMFEWVLRLVTFLGNGLVALYRCWCQSVLCQQLAAPIIVHLVDYKVYNRYCISVLFSLITASSTHCFARLYLHTLLLALLY